jgi:amino acid transporter
MNFHVIFILLNYYIIKDKHIMSETSQIGHQGVTLARTLGPGSIILLGIGSLLGGGIFTLLGPAAGLAGPGLFLAMILGAAVAFLNLQMYLALGTTFPEAGGGYLWVRKGLGNFQGFLAGWLSWFAHAAACGVYALSFGFYTHAFLQIFKINRKNCRGDRIGYLRICKLARHPRHR